MGYLFLVVFLLILLYFLFVLPTKWLKIEHISHPLGLNKKVLQLSDIHIERNRISASKIKDLLKKHEIDSVFITGDFLDQPEYLPQIKTYLIDCHFGEIPVFAVLGNHDYLLPQVESLIEILKDLNIQVLRNEIVEWNGVQLIGIDDYCTGHSDIENSFYDREEEKPCIILTHDPNIVLTLREKFNYLVSGHLHGRQCNVPFFFRVIKMGPLPATGIYEGLHRNEYGTYYISKGIGQSGINLRLFVRSEVTIHYF